MKVVLFVLTGGGDTYIFLAPQAAYDFLQACSPGFVHLPDDVKQAMLPFLDPMFEVDPEEEEEGILLTTGSCDNDLALAFSCRLVGYDTVSQALKALKKKGWTLSDDEYVGMIY